MASYEIQRVIDQSAFIETTDKLLGEAEHANTSLEASVQAINTVKQTFSEIKDGTLKVKPPLSQEQTASYAKRIDIINNLTKKALEALEESSAPATSEAKDHRRGFLGRGQSAKA